jgi:hypothetical protein
VTRQPERLNETEMKIEGAAATLSPLMLSNHWLDHDHWSHQNLSSKEGPHPHLYELSNSFLISCQSSSDCPASRQLNSCWKSFILNKVLSPEENRRINMEEAKRRNELEIEK